MISVCRSLATGCIYAEKPHLLSAEKRIEFDAWHNERLMANDVVPWLTLARPIVQTQKVIEEDPEDMELFAELAEWFQSLSPFCEVVGHTMAAEGGAMAYWKPDNLESHYQKHPAGKYKKCWMDLLNTTTPVEKSEYEAESKKVIKTAWIVYRAEELNQEAWWDAKANPEPPFHSEGIYYTDARLVRTITNVRNDEIRTCYHEHFDRPHEMGSGSMTDVERTEAKLKYVNRLINRRGQQLRGLKIEKTEDRLPEPIRLKIEELKR
jgi:hypothetical protein